MSVSLVARLTATVSVIIGLAFLAWLTIVYRSSASTFVEVQSEFRVGTPDATGEAALVADLTRAWAEGGWDAVGRLAASDDRAGYLVLGVEGRIRVATAASWAGGRATVRDDGAVVVQVEVEDAGRAVEQEVVDTAPIELRGTDDAIWGRLVMVPAPALEDGEQGRRFALRLWRRTAGWLAAVVALTVVATTLIVRRALIPIARLTAVARDLQRGRAPKRLPRSGPSEFHGLVDAFNAAADALAGTEQLRRQVIADVSHELRTPVTNLKAQLEAAQQGMLRADADLLATLQAETRLLERLVDDFQQLTLSDAGRLRLHLQTLPLRDELEAVIEPLARTSDARWRIDGPSDLCVVADAERLRQVVTNLTENAVRHRPGGLELSVVVRDEPPGAVAFIFRDNGPGVTVEDAPHIFDRFYRADRSRSRTTGGSGLGLAIVRGLVDAMAGSVRYEPADGGGASFVVTLPRAGDARGR